MKANSQKVRIVKARIFTVYFEAMYKAGKDIKSISVCKVLADTTEEAIAKAKMAYPGEDINSVFNEDRLGSLTGPDRPEGDWIVI